MQLICLACAFVCGLAASPPALRSSSLRLVSIKEDPVSTEEAKAAADEAAKESEKAAKAAEAGIDEFAPISDGKSHGDHHQYNKETGIKVGPEIEMWTGESELPFSVECIIAVFWVGLVGSMPMIIMASEGKNITRTQQTISVTMWIVFFAGIYLFTNVIYFQSSHFENERSLTMVECVYLMSQVLTTVGYGDITPSRRRGQVFVGLYVIFAIMIMANIVSEVSSLVVERTAAYANRMREEAMKFEEDKIGIWAYQKRLQREAAVRDKQAASAVKSASPETELPDGSTPRHSAEEPVIKCLPPPIEWKPLVIACVAFGFFCVAGWFFFTRFPGENKTDLEGVYMSVITLSTVGFGAVTPSTEGGKVFAAFWMLFGTGALVNVVGKFMELTVNLKAREKWKGEADTDNLKAVLMTLPTRVTFGQFLIGCVVKHKLVDKDEIFKLQALYDDAKQKEGNEDGKVCKEDIVKIKFVKKVAAKRATGGKFNRGKTH